MQYLFLTIVLQAWKGMCKARENKTKRDMALATGKAKREEWAEKERLKMERERLDLERERMEKDIGPLKTARATRKLPSSCPLNYQRSLISSVHPMSCPLDENQTESNSLSIAQPRSVAGGRLTDIVVPKHASSIFI